MIQIIINTYKVIFMLLFGYVVPIKLLAFQKLRQFFNEYWSYSDHPSTNIANYSHCPRTCAHTQSALCSFVLCVWSTSIHLERLLNETGQSRSQLASLAGQWAKIVGPKYAGKCSNFQLARTHRHSCMWVCLMKYLKLSTANRVHYRYRYRYWATQVQRTV